SPRLLVCALRRPAPPPPPLFPYTTLFRSPPPRSSPPVSRSARGPRPPSSARSCWRRSSATRRCAAWRRSPGSGSPTGSTPWSPNAPASSSASSTRSARRAPPRSCTRTPRPSPSSPATSGRMHESAAEPLREGAGPAGRADRGARARRGPARGRRARRRRRGVPGPAGPHRQPPCALRRAHRHRPVRRDRVREVLTGQRSGRDRHLADGSAPPHHLRTCRPVVGERGGDALLDWLEVEQRHHLDGTGSALAEAARRPPAGRRARREATPGTPGIVLLDLPDLDSVQSTNRSVAERMTGLVDVLVWVTDPQKYADAVIHQEFVRPF